MRSTEQPEQFLPSTRNTMLLDPAHPQKLKHEARAKLHRRGRCGALARLPKTIETLLGLNRDPCGIWDEGLNDG